MRDAGVTMVEAAFATPVFFLLIFGIVELGLYQSDNLAVASTVRAGSRVASASGNDTYADYGILRSVGREGAALDSAEIQYVVVYRASAFGAEPSPTCQGGSSVSGECNVYRPADLERAKGDFGCRPDMDLDEYWCPADRKVSKSGTGPAYVGVWVRYHHRWVTQIFGDVAVITDSSVIQLEPRVLE